jgi:hypothetical protein
MKKLFLITLSLIMSITVSFADTYTDDNGVTWSYSVDGDNITITGAEGLGETVVVPGTIAEKSVTTLSGTFSNNTTIKNVTVPTSVTSIGLHTFYGCTRLLHVEGLSNCTIMSDFAFYCCSKLKSVDLLECRTIGFRAFYSCSQLTNVGSLAKCQSIGESAFRSCVKLTAIGNLNSLTSVGTDAFFGCKELSATINTDVFLSIPVGVFEDCSKMNFEGKFVNCTSIGNNAFWGCSSFTDVKIESSVLESIGTYAFCSAKCVEIKAPQLLSINSSAFLNAFVVSINTTTPPTLGANVFNNNTTFSVPDALVETYKAATGWIAYASHILSDETQINYDITVTALDNSSAIHAAIGENNLANVVSLKVSGTINSYDIMIIRNKMPNLHNLNLSDASIVANDYEYYTGFHTEDNAIGAYAFYQLTKLFSVELPRTITCIGNNAFRNCTNLQEAIIPEGVTKIQGMAFYGCSNLATVAFPSSLINIEDFAFEGCAFTSVSLPPNLLNIANCAFNRNGNLREIRIPSSVVSIGNSAFVGCNNLLDIYTYTIEPTSIYEETFSNYTTATLHVPSTSFQNYYWDTEWSQFTTLAAFDEPYEYFYINKDYTLDEDNGRIDGEPDADLNPGSGLIVEGDEDQDLDDIHMKEDDDMGSSIIGDGNISANGLYIEFTIKKNKWYFYSFPYRIKLADIVCEGSYTFRVYDGEERANNGYGGWKHMPEAAEYLEPGQGYIFRCNQNTTLQIPVEKTEFGKFEGEDCQQNLETYASAGHPEDASWNFLGNPYPSYYDIDETGYDGPITVWNGTAYESVRPGDDEYHLRPFEAFFVQKPTNQEALEYDADGRHTYQQWDKIVEQKAQARRRASGVERTRHLINLVLSDGINTDKARVVFNEKCSADYEIGTDAAKFMATDRPQLYTIDGKQVRYAINERPEGEVRLGYVATEAGEMTISTKRMDKAVVLYDTETGISTDLSQTGYTFTTEAGTFNQRFILRSAGATGINSSLTESSENASVYTLDGVQVENTKPRQVYIQEGKKIISK